MRHAETVTFGGAGLDRAAHLRSDVAAQLAQPDARCILLWRGKPLVTTPEGEMLARLPLDHPIFADADDGRIFLGLVDEAPMFAADLSGWASEVDEEAIDSFVDQSQQQHPSLPDTHVFAELRAIMTHLSPMDAELAAAARAVMNWHASHGYCAKCGAKSDIAMAGWQRDCAACGTHHFPRTDPVVIMLITHGNNVLLGRSPGWPEGMFSLLAGFVESGETMEAAVRREVFEEAGVTVGPVRYLASQPWPFPASLMMGCAGEALDTEITIDPAEIEAARWVSREDLALAFAGGHPEILPARKGAIAQFLLENWLADRLD